MTSTQDPEITKRIITELAVLDRLRDRSETFNSMSSFATGSAAANDAATSQLLGAEPVRLAMVQLANSLDHLLTWRAVLSGGLQPAVAHMTLLRSSMEASVGARWLADPMATTGVRIARAAAWLREDYRLRKRVEELIKSKPKPPAKSAADRGADVDAEVSSLGLNPNIPINHTDMFRSYAADLGDKGELSYSVLSVYAHSRNWASLLQPMTTKGPGAAPGGAVVLTSANDSFAESFTVQATRTAELAARDIQRLLTP